MIYINTGFYITIFSFFIAMSRWGLLREQLMWHLLHKLLIMFFNVWEAQLLTDGAAVVTTSEHDMSLIAGSLHSHDSF